MADIATAKIEDQSIAPVAPTEAQPAAPAPEIPTALPIVVEAPTVLGPQAVIAGAALDAELNKATSDLIQQPANPVPSVEAAPEVPLTNQPAGIPEGSPALGPQWSQTGAPDLRTDLTQAAMADYRTAFVANTTPPPAEVAPVQAPIKPAGGIMGRLIKLGTLFGIKPA